MPRADIVATIVYEYSESTPMKLPSNDGQIRMVADCRFTECRLMGLENHVNGARKGHDRQRKGFSPIIILLY